MEKKDLPELPKNLGKNVIINDPGSKTQPIGKLKDYLGKTFVLPGRDGSGNEVEWVIKPTGTNSFELTVPKTHELGTPDAWENISIMTQRVVCASGSCGCDGNQCGCQGSNCGSNCMSNRGRIRLLGDEVSQINLQTLELLRAKIK